MYRRLKSKVHQLIASDPEMGGAASRYFDVCLTALIIANVIVVILESVEGWYLPYRDLFYAFDFFSVAVFTVEYILRLWTCTEHAAYQGPIRGRIKYLVTPLALIDLLAIAPFFLPLLVPIDLRFVRALRLARIFRLLKLGRHSYALGLLTRAFYKQKEILAVAGFVLVILLILSSSMMFYLEHDAQPEIFSSIPHTMWWAIATLTTVGYGDVYPIIPLGKLLGSFIAVLGIGMFAIPTGVLSTAFIEEIQKKNSETDQIPQENSLEETIALLERLGTLRDNGVVSDEEFQVQKGKILGR